MFRTYHYLVIILLVTGTLVTSQERCPEDYSPCSCTSSRDKIRHFLSCNTVPLSDVRNAFARTNQGELHQLDLIMSPTDGVISADLLGNKRATKITLSCPTAKYHLKVDPFAFRASTTSTKNFRINGCDLSQLDFAFLAGFDQLTQLTIGWSSNIHQTLVTLPELRSLSVLEIKSCSGLNKLVNFPKLFDGHLDTLNLNDDSDLDDEAASRILKWIHASSGKSLRTLRISGDQLKIIPPEIKSFEKLNNLNFTANSIPILTSDSLAFVSTNTVQKLSLQRAGIKEIEPGAFKGDFRYATVRLDQNELTRFEASVFLPILQQMNHSTGYGHIDIRSNPIDCASDPCHLAWLVRDNRYLMPNRVQGGTCSNGTYFEHLKLSGFAHCPVTGFIHIGGTGQNSSDQNIHLFLAALAMVTSYVFFR